MARKTLRVTLPAACVALLLPAILWVYGNHGGSSALSTYLMVDADNHRIPDLFTGTDGTPVDLRGRLPIQDHRGSWESKGSRCAEGLVRTAFRALDIPAVYAADCVQSSCGGAYMVPHNCYCGFDCGGGYFNMYFSDPNYGSCCDGWYYTGEEACDGCRCEEDQCTIPDCDESKCGQ